MREDYQGDYMPKTKLDYAVEYVEHKYNSLKEAPMSAIYWIRSVGLNNDTEKYNHHETSSKIPYDGKLKLRHSSQGLLTNNKHLVSTCHWVNQGKSVRLACELGGFSHGQFMGLHLVSNYYIYSYKKIHFKFNTYTSMFKDAKAMCWTFAPTNMHSIRKKKYMGTIKTIKHCAPISYRRVLV